MLKFYLKEKDVSIEPLISIFVGNLPNALSQIQYEKFEKNFYHEHDEIKALTNQKVNELRQTLGIKVSGLNPSKPVCSFAHFNFDEQLLKSIRKSEYTQPTPIQSQVLFVIKFII